MTSAIDKNCNPSACNPRARNHGASFFLIAAFIAASLSTAALILATWTTSSRSPKAVSQVQPGFAPHKGQTRDIGLTSSCAGFSVGLIFAMPEHDILPFPKANRLSH
jgi:hypothetical protein